MDEVNARHSRMQPQYSICSEVNGDDTYRNDASAQNRKICLVGALAKSKEVRALAETFNIPVVTSDNGKEYSGDESTIFVLETFEGSEFNSLFKTRQPQPLIGVTALKQLVAKKDALPNRKTRPLYNLAMTGVVVCFTGFRNKEDLSKLVPLIHHMGGSIRKDVSMKVTHLISNLAGGPKYHYAHLFRLPVLGSEWVYSSWEKRNDPEFVATKEQFVIEHKLKPFHGLKVAFVGFPEDEEKHMSDVLASNGGTVTTLDDTSCTHVVVDEAAVGERPDGPSKAKVVKAEWFWMSVQKEQCLEEKDFLFDDYIEQVLSPSSNRRDSTRATPTSASRRKRKRFQESLIQTLAHHPSPSLHKRRSSVSDAGILSVSGSFLDCTTSPDKAILEGAEPVLETPRKALTPRQQVFIELFQTESNYVDILTTILSMYRKLEEMPDEEALLNNHELNFIFGKIPSIHETHVKMLEEFRVLLTDWREDRSIGKIIVDHYQELQKAYPPFINFFEEMKNELQRCDLSKPRFHAFLKACQTRPECGRQSLQELMIRPVQRLGSISLLLTDILKHTPKTNSDHASLESALEKLRVVMTHINEDKRKAEGQITLFNIFNDIDNCPPEIVSSHRSFITKAEVIQLSSSEGLSSRGNNLVLYLFTDHLEVCKKKGKSFNSLKSPGSGAGGTSSLPHRATSKSYKHVRLMALSTIKKVIDINETEDCQKVFCLVCRNNDENKERLFTFAMADEDMDKGTFLRSLTRQIANNACMPDADKFIAYLEPQQLDIDTSDLYNNGTLSKAMKFASRTRLRVGRAFSFNKTPAKLKRAVSSMMSPFGSSTNLTPSSQLANMKLASYNNISELGNAENADSPPLAPMSVQPTRKMKSSTLGVNALKRL